MRQTGQHCHELGTCDPDGSADPFCGQATTFDHAGDGACRKAQIPGDLGQGQPLIGRERRWSARGSCIDLLRCDEDPCRQIRCVRPLDGTRRVVLMWLAPRWCLRHGAYEHGHPQRANAEPSVFWDRFCVAGSYERMRVLTGSSNLSSSANISMLYSEMLAQRFDMSSDFINRLARQPRYVADHSGSSRVVPVSAIAARNSLSNIEMSCATPRSPAAPNAHTHGRPARTASAPSDR